MDWYRDRGMFITFYTILHYFHEIMKVLIINAEHKISIKTILIWAIVHKTMTNIS